MPAPVIDPTTSILSFAQWLTWEFFFSASNAPTAWSVSAGGFPTGMAFQPQQAVTGVTSGSLLTGVGSAYSGGEVVQFASITGGAGLATATPYYVINPSTDTFQLSATAGGAAIAFSTAITAGAIFQPGQLKGAATVPGISNVQMVATNGTGDSAAVLFTIGIEPAANSPDSNVDAIVDLGTGAFIPQTSSVLNTTPIPRTTPVMYVKEGDGIIIRIRLLKDLTVISPTMTNLALVLKQFEPDRQIVLSTAWSQVGTGDGTSYLVYAKFAGNLLRAALSDYETDEGTSFPALAEIELTFDNPEGIGPATIQRTTLTFTVQIERDLGEVP